MVKKLPKDKGDVLIHLGSVKHKAYKKLKDRKAMTWEDMLDVAYSIMAVDK